VPDQRRKSRDVRAIARPHHRAEFTLATVGIRVDTAAYTDYVIPPFYDSLVAKLIAYGHDRTEAIARMRRAHGYVRGGRHLHHHPSASTHHAGPRLHLGQFDTFVS